MPLAVSNSSPLIHLSLIGRISLLRRFSEVVIPPAVWQEVVEQGGSPLSRSSRLRIAIPLGWRPGRYEKAFLLTDMNEECTMNRHRRSVGHRRESPAIGRVSTISYEQVEQ